MKSPLVSVVITTYNHALFIGQCIDSILAQESDFEYEILIGEDDSTDGTRKIVQEFEKRFPDRIKAFYRSKAEKVFVNGRMTGLYNLAATVAEARGKYVAMVDGDDFWLSETKMQKQVEILEDNDTVSIVHTDIKMIHEADAYRRAKPSNKRQGSIIDLIKGKIQVRKSSAMFRRNFLKFPEWYYHSPVADSVITLIAADQGSIYFIDEELTAYRVHSAGDHSGLTIEKRVEKNRIFWDLIKKNQSFFNTQIKDALKMPYFFMEFRLAKYYYRKGNIQKGLSAHSKAILNADLSAKGWIHAAKLTYDLLLGLIRGIMKG